MNFDSIIRSSYSWLSATNILWFIAFFWIALPVITILPPIFTAGQIYSQVTMPVAVLLYDVLYITLIFGVILLIQNSLLEKHNKVANLNTRKVIDLVFLVFVELGYILIWNISAKLRKFQILLIISSALLGYLFFISSDVIALVLFAWSLLGYFSIVIRNMVMVFFSTTVFCKNETIGIKAAIKESWAVTQHRVADTFSSIIVSAFLAFVLFAFITLALGAFSSILLRFFFIDGVAVSLGIKVATAFGLGIALIAYHFMIAEVYTQLEKHKAASSSIKRILSRRVLSPKSSKNISPRRSFAKKKTVKKKSRR
ncbi:MAG: hypothetical protein WCI04_00910 [archaeon]